MRKLRPLSDWLMLFALVACWGSTFSLNKVALASLAPLTVVALRLSIAAMVLVAVMLLQQRSLRLPWRRWGLFIIFAIIGNCLPFYLIGWGQQKIDSALAGILMAIIPLLTLLLSHFLIATERITRNKLLGFVIGFGGIVMLVGSAALQNLGGATLIAQLAVLGGAACYAVNVVITPYNRVTSTLVTSTATLLIASVIMLPIAFARHPAASLTFSADALLAIVTLGIFGTALPTLIFYRLVASAGPTFYSLINYLIPLWAVIAGALFLHERPDWNAYAALALILGGIGVSQIKRQPAKTR